VTGTCHIETEEDGDADEEDGDGRRRLTEGQDAIAYIDGEDGDKTGDGQDFASVTIRESNTEGGPVPTRRKAPYYKKGRAEQQQSCNFSDSGPIDEVFFTDDPGGDRS